MLCDRIFVLFSALGVLSSILMVAVPGIRYAVFLNTQWTRGMKTIGFVYAACVVTAVGIGLESAISQNV